MFKFGVCVLGVINPRTAGAAVYPPPLSFFVVDSEKTAARSVAKFCIAIQ